MGSEKRFSRTDRTDRYGPVLLRIKRRVNTRRDARRGAHEAHTRRATVVGGETGGMEGCGRTWRRGEEPPSHRRVEGRWNARRGNVDGIHVTRRTRLAQAAAEIGRCSSCSTSWGSFVSCVCRVSSACVFRHVSIHPCGGRRPRRTRPSWSRRAVRHGSSSSRRNSLSFRVSLPPIFPFESRF